MLWNRICFSAKRRAIEKLLHILSFRPPCLRTLGQSHSTRYIFFPSRPSSFRQFTERHAARKHSSIVNRPFPRLGQCSFVYRNPLKRKEPSEDKSNSAPNLLPAGAIIPPGEYETGRVICEFCGAGVSFRDDDTGEFSLKPWNAHRNSW